MDDKQFQKFLITYFVGETIKWQKAAQKEKFCLKGEGNKQYIFKD